jgi:hypothetical protein
MVQSAYEELLATDHTENAQRMISVSMASCRLVRYLGAAADSILVASSDGVLARFDASGALRSRRVIGRGDVVPALNPDGTLAAAWCDGVLSFFRGDFIINSTEIDGYPRTPVPWGGRSIGRAGGISEDVRSGWTERVGVGVFEGYCRSIGQ